MVFGNGIQRFVLLLWSLYTLHTNLTTWKTCDLWPLIPLTLIYPNIVTDARNKKKLGPVCQIIEVINVHKWWNPH